MSGKQNPSAGSQVPSAPGPEGEGAHAGSAPGQGRRSRQEQYIELPEHQGVMIDYIPPRGGLRSEVGDFDAGSDSGGIQAESW